MSEDHVIGMSGETMEKMLQGGAEPGSKTHEQAKAALQLRIAKLQRDTAEASLQWAKIASVSNVVATTIALVALLVALF